MNNAIRAMLNDGEQELLRESEPAALEGLDEDGLLDLHGRVRAARNKYTKLYRRRAADQVVQDAGRARAHAAHARTAVKAEVFEDALARVSRRLAQAAKAAAAELKTERIAASRRTATPAPTVPKRARSGTARRPSSSPGARRKTAISPRSRASKRAATGRRQAARDGR